jgi:hypothetical protein
LYSLSKTPVRQSFTIHNIYSQQPPAGVIFILQASKGIEQEYRRGRPCTYI